MKKWTDEEDSLLINSYQLKQKEIENLFPNRSKAALNIRASKLGLKKHRNEYRQSNLDILLKDELISLYIIGLILTDGSISNNRLTIVLQSKDSEYLLNIAVLLDTKLSMISNHGYSACKISAQDSYIIPKLKEKYDIQKNKTYNPPRNVPSNLDLCLAMFIGMIDGDGSIGKQYKRNDAIIRIKCHSSWINFYQLICNQLEIATNIKISKPKIDNTGYMVWNIANKKVIFYLTEFVKKHKLPILKRKWNNTEKEVCHE